MGIPEYIAEARLLNTQTASLADYQRLFDRIANGHIFATIIPRDGSWYRVRRNLDRELFRSTRELWYPPARNVQIGRANEAGNPVLYLSNDGAVAVRETRFSSRDWLTVLTCQVISTATLKLHEIGIGEHVHKDNLPAVTQEINRLIHDAHRSGHGDPAHHALVRNYFVEEFTREVSVGHEHEYKPSAAFASLLMGRTDCDGIAYPAIKSGKLDINIALKPHSADQKLHVVAVDIVEAKKSDNGEIWVTQIATSSNINADGLISYRDTKGQTASLPWVDSNRRMSI